MASLSVRTGLLAQAVAALIKSTRASVAASVLAAPNVQTGTAYTLALTDQSGAVEMTSTSANTLTVPANATVAFPIGTLVEITQASTGQTTIAASSGVTIRTAASATTRAQWSSVGLRKRGTDEWILSGDLT